MAGSGTPGQGAGGRTARRARRAVLGAAAGIAVVVAVMLWRLAAQAPASGAAPPAPPLAAASPAQIEQGRELYARHCAACHGANLEGEADWRQRKPSGRLPAPPHDDSGHTWHHPDEVLLGITRHGMRAPFAPEGYESDMPGFLDVIGEDGIRAVLGFIASRWSEPSRAHQLRIDRAWRESR